MITNTLPKFTNPYPIFYLKFTSQNIYKASDLHGVYNKSGQSLYYFCEKIFAHTCV